MSDEKALLAAIREHPHEDTARLVFADWLQEQGGAVNAARAEFIRAQCELARLDASDPRREELAARAEALRKKHSGKWKGKVGSFVRQAKYERGFPYPERQVRVCRFATIPAAEWDEAPLWGVSLVQHSHKAFAPILDSPHLLRVGRLVVETGDWRDRQMQPDDAVRLVRSPYVRNLTHLDFSYNRVGPAPFVALAEAPPLPHLVSLRAVNCVHDGAGLSELIGSNYPAQLTEFTWWWNSALTGHVVALFHAANRFAKLQTLSLHANAEAGVNFGAELATCGAFPDLRALSFEWSGPTDELAAALAAWPGLARVRRLILRGSGGLALPGAQALIRSPHAPAAFESLRCNTHYGPRATILKMLADRFGTGVRE